MGTKVDVGAIQYSNDVSAEILLEKSPMVRKLEVDGRLLVRLPKEVKTWIEREAAHNGSSQNSEIIRSIRCRMDSEQQRDRAAG
jgi:predicted HicB family RNase H-like nuclease